MMRRSWALTPLIGALIVLLVACGGDDDDDNEAANGDTGASSNGVATTGATGPTGAVAPTLEPSDSTPGQQSGGGGDGELDIAAASQALTDVQSFRYEVGLSLDFELPEGSGDDELGAALMGALLGDVRASGSYVAPDRVEMMTQLFGQELHIIQIGEQGWTNDGSGWVASGPDASLGLFGGALPTEFAFDFLPQEVLSGGDVSTEDLNGVSTRRYTFDDEALGSLATDLSEETGEVDQIETITLDVWVTEDEGIPIRILMNVEGESEGSPIALQLDVNISNVNDGSIAIDPPI